MGRQQWGAREVSMWEARKQEAFWGKLADRGVLASEMGEDSITECLLRAGCFTFMIAFNLHNKLQGGY